VRENQSRPYPEKEVGKAQQLRAGRRSADSCPLRLRLRAPLITRFYYVRERPDTSLPERLARDKKANTAGPQSLAGAALYLATPMLAIAKAFGLPKGGKKVGGDAVSASPALRKLINARKGQEDLLTVVRTGRARLEKAV